MSTILSIILIILGVASLIIPSWQLIYNKRHKGVKAITIIGRLMLITSLLLVIAGIGNVFVLNKEKAQDDIALRKDLTDSFNKALKNIDSTLKFDPSSNRIVNKYFNNNNAVVINGGTDNSFINNTISAPPPRPLLSTLIDTAQFFSNFKEFEKQNKISGKSVYFLIVTYTNGNQYFMDFKKMFTARNYTVIEPAIGLRLESFKNPIPIQYGINFTISNGKIGVVIGNLY